MAHQGEITVTNDIGTALDVRVTQDEGPDDLNYVVIVRRGNIRDGEALVFYFNTEEEFRDWIISLQRKFL